MNDSLVVEKERSASFEGERQWAIKGTLAKMTEALTDTHDATIIDIKTVVAHFLKDADVVLSHEAFFRTKNANPPLEPFEGS